MKDTTTERDVQRAFRAASARCPDQLRINAICCGCSADEAGQSPSRFMHLFEHHMARISPQIRVVLTVDHDPVIGVHWNCTANVSTDEQYIIPWDLLPDNEKADVDDLVRIGLRHCSAGAKPVMSSCGPGRRGVLPLTDDELKVRAVALQYGKSHSLPETVEHVMKLILDLLKS